MADFVFNISLGRIAQYHANVDGNTPANSAIVLVLLQSGGEADDALRDHDTLAAVLGSNTEATFTDYARIVLTDADLSAATVDDTANEVLLDLPDQTWSGAGNGTNNALAKLLHCYDGDTTGGADSDIVPVAGYDFAATTTGADLDATFHADGYARID